jgi:outer membrane immunogenic protein
LSLALAIAAARSRLEREEVRAHSQESELMKRLAIFALAVAATGVATAALADGLPSRAAARPAMACPAHAWQGFYFGAQLGSGYYSSQIASDDLLGLTTRHDDNNGFLGGGQIGYNWAACNSVFGLEADIAWANLESNWGLNFGSLAPGIANPNLFSARSEIEWLSTIRTRAGITVDNMLLYLTGGVAFADITHSGTTTIPAATLALFGPGTANAAFSDSGTRWGWVTGAGLEYRLTEALSLKSEALYVRFEDESFFYSFTPLTGVAGGLNLRAHDDLWVARFGLNYKFGDRMPRAEPLK